MRHETSIADAIKQAERAHHAGDSWHFHMLAPNCVFSSSKLQHTLLVENCTTREEFVAYSEERPTEAGKKLVALLHGKKILTGQAEAHASVSPNTAAIISRAQQLNEREIPWHHHMLFPDCNLNPHPGEWCLIFEDPESGEKIEAIYTEEPVGDLKEVEALFYAQKK